MSIVSRMETVKVLKQVQTVGALQTKVSWEEDRTILASFSFNSGALTQSNATSYDLAQYTALTKDKNLTTDNRIERDNVVYTLTYVNNDSGKYATLFLKKVE